jgi:hypothetical protein
MSACDGEKSRFWGYIDERGHNRAEIARNLAFVELPESQMNLAACMYILGEKYGFVKSLRQGMTVDEDGEYLPMYTYPAIEYLEQFDITDKRLFEFGAGASTLFWMNRAQSVTSVENDQSWIEQLGEKVDENVELVFAEGDAFPLTIRETDGKFDLIIVDGAGYRYDCAVEALDKLASGGVIVLDNSDWYPNTAAMLKQSGLLQVDMTGFKPGYSHTSTTSLFLHREFDFPTIRDRQPAYGIGAKHIHSVEWDTPKIDRKR